VTAFAKAEDALRVLAGRQGEVDLLVTDVVLSGMSGPSLVGRLRQQGSPLKVLYVSGYTNGAVFARGLEENVDRLLYKPFSMRDLAHAVRAVLEEAS
jgi:two-component system cell cycle sensor histidine kinase/response regulator CckA